MGKTITIDPVTRIEGHAKITLQTDEHGEVSNAYFHVTQFRGFEKFCEGRPFYEMPYIMERTWHLPGKPSTGIGKGLRRAFGSARATRCRETTPRSESCANHPIACAEFLLPLLAGSFVGHGC